MESDVAAEPHLPDAFHEEQSTVDGADSLQSSHPHRTMALLEGLPTEIVSLIGDQLDPWSLAQLRSTSKTMNDHLSFNLKCLLKSIWCRITSSDELFWFMRQPLANAVESLVWVRHGSTWMEPTPLAEVFPWTYGNSTQHGVIELFVAMWMSAAGFRNLRSIGWIPEEAWVSGLNDVSATYLDPGDLSFWSAVVKKIRRPLEVRVYEREKVYWGFDWTGSKETTTGAFVRTSFPVEVIHGADDDSLEDWQRLSVCFRHMSALGDKLHSDRLGSLELHRTIVDCYYLKYFEGAQVKIWECRINNPLEHYLFYLPNKPGGFLQTVRNLSILNCSLEAQKRSSIVRFLAGLRDHGQLQSFQFERIRIQYGEHVGDLTFDWDNDGCPDDGARLRGVIDDMGMEMALTKAIDCVHVPGKPLAARMANRESPSWG